MADRSNNVIGIKDDYLGDGVYCSFDGHAITLDVRAQAPTDACTTGISLDAEIFDALNRYRERINDAVKAYEAQHRETTPEISPMGG